MKILALETINFRNLKNKQIYRFDVSPLTIIHGPNEAGKSSILEAIEIALFKKADKKSDLDFMTRGAAARPVVKLTVEHNAEQVTIERNYQDGKSYLKGGGLDLKDEKQIAKIIHEMLGFNDPETFRNLLIVKQNEMRGLNAKGIQKEIDTLVAGGSGGMTTTEILFELNSKLLSQKTGFKSADGKKYDALTSSLLELQEKKQVLEVKLETVQDDREALEKNQKELKELESRKATAEKSLAWLNAYVLSREAADIKKKVDTIDAQLALLLPDLGRARADIKSREDKLSDLQAVRELEGKHAFLAEQLKNPYTTKNALEEKKKQLTDIDSNLTGKPVPSKEDLKAFRNLVATNSQIEETLKAAEVILSIRALKDIGVESNEAVEKMTAGQEKEYPFRAYEGLITIQDTVGLKVINKGLEQSSDDLKTNKANLIKLTAKYGTDSVSEMEDRHRKQEEKERISAEFTKLGGDPKITGLQNEIEGIEAKKNAIDGDIATLKAKIGDATALEVEEGILKDLKAQLKAKEDTERNLDGDRKTLLGPMKLESIEKDIERAQITLAGLIETVSIEEKDRYIGLSVDELKKQIIQISDELKAISLRHTACDREVVRLAAELKNAPAYEYLVEIEEKIGAIKPLIEQADIYLKAFVALEEGLREAQAKTRDLVSKGINDSASGYFKTITQGKYDGVEVTLGDGIEVQVKEAGNPNPIPIDNGRPLSTGALQQLYFAIRVSLVEALTGGKKPPLLFDDPFVDFDAVRTKEAVQTLVRLSQAGHQCIHLTCHDTIVVEGAGSQEVVTLLI